jgi:hypothetical protein
MSVIVTTVLSIGYSSSMGGVCAELAPSVRIRLSYESHNKTGPNPQATPES